jgi:methyl-accepting chemotaxis protein
MIRKSFLVAAVAAFGLTMIASPAFAQRGANSKTLNTAYNINSSYTYQSHAYQQSGLLNDYATTSETVPQTVVNEHSQAIRASVAAASKQYHKLQDIAKTNPEAAKKLAEIKEHHAKVIELCDQLDGHAAGGEASAADIKATTDEINQTLQQADEAHKALSTHLGVESK